MLAEAEQSPISYIDNFLYTFDPKREPYHLRFHPFTFQRTIIEEVKQAIEEGYDLFIEKSREIGVTYTVLGTFLWFWRYIPGSNFLLGSRKESYVDNRGEQGEGEQSNKEESLFGKLDYMIGRQPTALLPAGFDKAKHMPFMTLKNPENGNVISGESSNPNFSRGGRFKAAGMDEFAFWENDSEAWGSTADTTNCRIVFTTPGIKPNTKAKRLRFGTDGEKIKILSFHARLDPRKDEKYFVNEKGRRSTEDYAREIDINWETAVRGRVYDEIRDAKIGDFPFIANCPLYTSWDFGLDGTSFGLLQPNLKNGRMRLIHSFHTSNQPIHFFMPFFGHPIDSTFTYSDDEIDLINILKDLPDAVHYGDPDVAKRAYQDKATKSTRQVLESFGIYVQTKPEANDFYTRREQTKVLLAKGFEINDTPQNRHFLDAIKSAVYPDRDPNSQATSAIILPIHNWTSHPRTMLEYFSVNYEPTFYEEPDAPAWAGSAPNYNGR